MAAVLKVDSNMKCSMVQYESTVYTDVLKKNNRSITPIPNRKSVTPKKRNSITSVVG